MAEDGRNERLEVQVTSRQQWRDWLRDNAPDTDGCWVVTWRKGSGQPVVDYDELVEEALCVGWVDSRPRKVDEHRTALLMTPSKPGSGWSRRTRSGSPAWSRRGSCAHSARRWSPLPGPTGRGNCSTQ